MDGFAVFYWDAKRTLADLVHCCRMRTGTIEFLLGSAIVFLCKTLFILSSFISGFCVK
ncbi:hypothetical protein B4110_2638 [Parageobacillus toebii]|uniref:Uncharacterized protein n=1 Tax=Parageobacillus toebii TaxID=153151 RepID=A0A150N7Z5_9BACL|nr:hypothetical protein B4110_2638 [Parageobacillus toebii]